MNAVVGSQSRQLHDPVRGVAHDGGEAAHDIKGASVGCSLIRRTNCSGDMAMTTVASTARTLAKRGAPSMAASSPKYSPGVRSARVTSRPPIE